MKKTKTVTLEDADQIRFEHAKNPLDMISGYEKYDDVPGYKFRRIEVEEMIENFGSMDVCELLLQQSHTGMDDFCQKVYGLNWDETYNLVSRKGIMDMQKAITSLSKSGNATALNISSKQYLNYSDDESGKAQRIIIESDIDK